MPSRNSATSLVVDASSAPEPSKLVIRIPGRPVCGSMIDSGEAAGGFAAYCDAVEYLHAAGAQGFDQILRGCCLLATCQRENEMIMTNARRNTRTDPH
jgi:hypothetical protein